MSMLMILPRALITAYSDPPIVFESPLLSNDALGLILYQDDEARGREIRIYRTDLVASCGARASLLASAQSMIPFKAGWKDSPSSVSRYSTLGGTSA